MVPHRVHGRRAPAIEALEPRLLHSGDAAGAVLAETAAWSATAVWPAAQDGAAPARAFEAADASGATVRPAGGDLRADSAARELAVVDTRVPDAGRLLADLAAQRAAGRPVDVLVLDEDADAVASIGRALAEAAAPYAAVHLFGHGDPGEIRLGGAPLDLATLRARTGEIAAWSAGLTADADLLLWGCDTGAGDAGRSLVEGLAALTGADVAASDDATGGLRFGGDWTLEVAHGAIEARAPLGLALQAGFAGVLEVGPPSSGSEDVQVNTTIPGTQRLSDAAGGRQLATNASGVTVAAWFDTTTGEVWAQTFDAAGDPLGGPVRVDANGTVDRDPAVAIADDGSFVVAWVDGAADKVYARRFQPDGTDLHGPVRVDDPSAGVTGDPVRQPSVATTGSGGFVVAWAYGDSGDEDVGYRLFAADTAPVGNARFASPSTVGSQNGASVAMRADGSFAIVYHMRDPDSGQRVAVLQRFTASGDPAPGAPLEEAVFVAPAGNSINDLSIAATASGGYVVAGAYGPSGEGTVFARVADGTTGFLTGVVSVDGDADRIAGNPSVAALADGGFVVAWQVRPTLGGVNWDISARQFDASANPVGESQRINRYDAGQQRNPSVAVVGTSIRVLWDGASDTDTAGVSMRTAPLSSPGITVENSGTTTDEAGSLSRTVTFRLDAPPTAPVTLTLSVTDPDEGHVSTTSLTFDTSNWDVEQTVTIDGVDDQTVDGDRPFALAVSVASADGRYHGMIVPPLAFSNVDDDVAGLQVQTPSGTTTGEWGAGVPLSVSLLSRPTATVQVTVSASGGESTLAPVVLVFDPDTWNVAQWVTVAGADDPDADGDRTYEVRLSVASLAPGYGSLPDVTRTFLNLDDDTPALDPAASPVLDGGTEDDPAPAGAVGTRVSTLVDLASQPGGLDNVVDPSPGAAPGIAVIGADADHGTWWYTIDDGASWQALGAVSDASARLLAADAQTRLYFQPDADWNGTLAAAITFRAWDAAGGFNGTLADARPGVGVTAFSSLFDTASLSVASTNDLPAANDTSASGLEDAASIAIVLDGDDADGSIVGFRATTLPGQGTLYANPALTVQVAVGDDVAAVGGTATVYFVPTAGWSGTTGFEYVALDDAGDESVVTASATITVSAVNDAPVLGAPAALATPEDTAFTLAPANGTGLSVSSVDGDATSLRVSLQVDSGSLTLASVAGLAFEAGDGVEDAMIRITGSVADLAQALASVVYRPAADHHGAVTLTLAAAPLADAARSASASVAITVESVDDAPLLRVEPVGVRSTVPGGTLPIGRESIVAFDVDNAPSEVIYTLEQPPSAGRIVLAGVTLAAGDRFTQADVDAGRIAFVAPPSGGTQTIVLSVADAGGTSAGGQVTMKFSVDVPEVARPAPVTVFAAPGGSSGIAPPAPAPEGWAAGVSSPAAVDAGSGADAAQQGGLAAQAAAQAGRTGVGMSVGARGGSSASATPLSAGAGTARPVNEAWVPSRGDAADGSGRDAAAAATLRGTSDDASAASERGDVASAGSDPAAVPDEGWRRALAGTPEARASAAQAGSPWQALRGSGFAEELDQAREASLSRFELRDAIVASSMAVATSLSVGYVVWVLRGGVLLTGLLASMPAWRSIDPLPVLARVDARGRDDADEDDSLRGLLRSAADRAAGRDGPSPAHLPADPSARAAVAHAAEPS
ncbi:MAG: DUF4347 domain-containing protein [Burkholderiales bacterium]|nr:DUF4347 domain-containing protein [Burkholderiales bacterium]